MAEAVREPLMKKGDVKVLLAMIACMAVGWFVLPGRGDLVPGLVFLAIVLLFGAFFMWRASRNIWP